MENLTDIAVFVKVVECGSFTRAADQLELSRAAISKYLSRIEERLGVRLLNRTTRRLSLTEAGAELFEASRGALERIGEAEESIARLQREPKGRLKINAPMSFGVLHLAAALPEFLKRYPGIHIDLRMDDRIIDLHEEGFDVGIRIARLKDSSLVAKKLTRCRQVLCASPAYLEESGEPQSVDDLASHNCIQYLYAAEANVWRFNAPNGRAIQVAVQGNLRVNNGMAGREAAVQGLGILHSPTFYVGEYIRQGKLRTVLADYELPELGIHAVWPQRAHVPPKVRVFVEFLAKHFGPNPRWDKY
jgi:DNA-binding transcriptional LysR family regulator